MINKQTYPKLYHYLCQRYRGDKYYAKFFLLFLKQNNILDKFEKSIDQNYYPNALLYADEFVLRNANWGLTTDKSQYWQEVHQQWKPLCRKLRESIYVKIMT